MKNLLVVTLLFVSTFTLFGQRKPKIKGSKVVIQVSENLEPYTAIELIDDLDILLAKSTHYGYDLEIDDNLVDVLNFKVENGILKISSFYNITSKKKLNITVYFQELNSITLSDGKLMMKDVISADELTINTSGTSKLELNATADILDINMSGRSSGDFNVASDSLTVMLKEKSNLKLYATGDSNAMYMYNNTSAKMEGTTNTFVTKMYGNASLKAAEYRANDVLVISEDSPSTKVRALKTLQLSSKGSSKTVLYGDPQISILDFLDKSNLAKATD